MAQLLILLAFVLPGAALLLAQQRRLGALESRVAGLEAEAARTAQAVPAPPHPGPPPTHAAGPAAAVVAPPHPVPEHRVSASLVAAVPPGRTAPEAPGESPPRFSLEALIGGRLPIWTGGAALVLAAFFLVRFSIENGLLGPAARTLIGAAFSALLLAGSEAARRLPATRDDPRIAQVLAGAGIASAYAILYVAAALYHLVGSGSAFALMLAITALGLAMALRHGPPAAVMALIGGFAAPLVAGFEAAGVGPLLVYLALFVAALFGLAIRRGWAWLAIAATLAGFGWLAFLSLALDRASLGAVGAFAVGLAAAASAALPAAGARDPRVSLVPLLLGFVQLAVLAPMLDFGWLSWSYYLVLSGAALFLAWRDSRFVMAAGGSLALLLMLEGAALAVAGRGATSGAAILAALLFALPGHLFAQRGRGWALLGLGGTAGPLLVAHSAAVDLLPRAGWGALELLAGVAAASLAWRLRRSADAPPLVAASAVAGLLGALGLAQFVPDGWVAVPIALAALGLGLWARARDRAPLRLLPAVALAVGIVAATLPLADTLLMVGASLLGERTPFALLPPVGSTLRLLLPTLAAAAALLVLDDRAFARARPAVAGVALVVALQLVHLLAKQPLAIATPAAFAAWGFVERVALTQACFVAGGLLLRRAPNGAVGTALIVLGLFRTLWFDLLWLNPAVVAQAVGALPVANVATLHLAAAAAWCWALARGPALRGAALGLTVAAVLAAVRQATHGTLMVGPVGTLENGGYSAALLALALVWLWRGIATAARLLRVTGLGLLTLVTFKVFLVDAAALDGVLRILSFLALGLALIAIGWAYRRFVGKESVASP